MKIKPSYLINISWFMLFLASIALTYAVTNGIVDPIIFFNSDGLYLANLHKSLFITKNSFYSWKFPLGPRFFPELFTFSLVELVVNNYFISLVVSPLIIFTLIVIFLIKLSDNIFVPKLSIQKSICILFGSLFVLLTALNITFVTTIDLLSPASHAGVLLISVVLLVLYFKNRKSENTHTYVLTFLLATLTTVADKSLVKDLFAPILVVFMFNSFLDRKINKRSLKFIVLLTAGILTGVLVYSKIIPTPQGVSDVVPWYAENFQGIASFFKQVFSQLTITRKFGEVEKYFINYLIIYIPLIIISLLVSAFYSLKHFFNNIENPKSSVGNKNLLLLGVFALFQFLACFAAVTHFGDFKGVSDTRYFIATFIFPIFWLLLYLLDLLRKNKKMLKAIFYILIVVHIPLYLLLIKKSWPGGFSNILKYKPPNVECADLLSEKYGLKYGLSSYWNSTPISMFTNKDVKVIGYRTVRGFLIPYYEVNSYEWYLGGDYSFILTEGYREFELLDDLGQPDETAQCETSKVLIYEGDRLSKLLNDRFHAYFLFKLLKDPGDSYIIEAPDFESHVSSPFNLYGTKIENQIVEGKYLSPKDGEGFFSNGPYLMVKQGSSYRITIKYSTSSENTGFFDVYTFPNKDRKRIDFVNTEGHTKSYSYVFRLSEDEGGQHGNIYRAGRIGFFPYYRGKGDVKIESLTITLVE